MNRQLTRSDKLVALAVEAGEPLSAAEIARRTGVSERTVVTARARLVEAGVLELIDRGAGRRAPRYRRPNGLIVDTGRFARPGLRVRGRPDA